MMSTTITRLLISEGIVDHIANMYFITDDGDNTVKIIAELFRFFPCFTVGENRMQYSEIIPG